MRVRQRAYTVSQQTRGAGNASVRNPNRIGVAMDFVPCAADTHQNLIGTFRAAKAVPAEIIGPSL